MTTLGENCTEVSKGGNTKPPLDKGRHRAYAFTAFTESPPLFCTEEMKYLCYAPEICPKTGKHHFQSYVVWVWAKTWTSVQKYFKKHHIEIAYGDVQDNIQYIQGPWSNEDGTKKKPLNPEFKEFGDRPHQGERSDIIAKKNEILDGKVSVDTILTQNPEFYHQYGRTLHKIEDLAMRKRWRTEMTKGIWYVGSTGVGKSHTAFENYNPETHYNLPLADNGWWDEYTQQDTVIINDFRGEIPYNQLLQMVDKWPYSVRRRNRVPLPFTSKTVIVTSSLRPEQVYHRRAEEDNIAQLWRRFEIIEMNERR